MVEDVRVRTLGIERAPVGPLVDPGASHGVPVIKNAEYVLQSNRGARINNGAGCVRIAGQDLDGIPGAGLGRLEVGYGLETPREFEIVLMENPGQGAGVDLGNVFGVEDETLIFAVCVARNIEVREIHNIQKAQSIINEGNDEINCSLNYECFEQFFNNTNLTVSNGPLFNSLVNWFLDNDKFSMYSILIIYAASVILSIILYSIFVCIFTKNEKQKNEIGNMSNMWLYYLFGKYCP